MKRIATANREIDKFGAGKDGFKAAVAGVSDATYLSALFMNHVQEALARTREAAGIAVPADGDFDWMVSALRSGALVYGIDTGAANVYTVAYTPAITTLTDGMVLRVKAKTANTGASTLAVNAIPGKPVLGLASSALQGGEISANGYCLFIYSLALDSYILIACSGGALQVAPGLKSNQAVNLGQFVHVPAQNGYLKLPSGLIIQWGATGAAVAGTDMFQVLPIGFPNAFYAAVVSQSYTNSSGSVGYLSGGPNTGSLTTIVWRGSAGGNSGYFIAIGQ